MGYRPNPMMAAHWEVVRARSAPSFQSVIAVLNDWETAPSLKSFPRISPLYSAFVARAESLGYQVEEFSIAGEDHADRRKKLVSTLRILKARGILAFASLLSAHPQTFDSSIESLKDFAMVFIGAEYQHADRSMLDLRHIPFHRTNPDHYGNMLVLLEELKNAGYQRPAFWPNSWIEARAAGESAAAFNFWIQSLPAAQRIPVEWLRWNIDSLMEVHHRKFLKWLPKKKPDVVICQNIEVRDWISELGLRIPSDIGLAHLDLAPPEADWSGIDAQLESVAAAGVDLLTAHLHRNERGVPATPKDIRIRGRWVKGKTTKLRAG